MSGTKDCRFDPVQIGFRGNSWRTQCGKDILYVVPLGQGVAEPPLPTGNGAKFCTFCGKPIKILDKHFKKYQEPPLPPVESVPEPVTAQRPLKPHPLPRPTKHLAIDKEHDTYEGWIARGMQVQRGEKMKGRSPDGVAVFHKKQVKPIEKKSRGRLGGFNDDDFPDICDY